MCLPWASQVVDSGVGEGACFFVDGLEDVRVEHGYLLNADGSIGKGDFTFDLSRRKIVQCEARAKGQGGREGGG